MPYLAQLPLGWDIKKGSGKEKKNPKPGDWTRWGKSEYVYKHKIQSKFDYKAHERTCPSFDEWQLRTNYEEGKGDGGPGGGGEHFQRLMHALLTEEDKRLGAAEWANEIQGKQYIPKKDQVDGEGYRKVPAWTLSENWVAEVLATVGTDPTTELLHEEGTQQQSEGKKDSVWTVGVNTGSHEMHGKGINYEGFGSCTIHTGEVLCFGSV